MFITRECDYAVRTIRALAPGEKRTVKDICEVEDVPQPYAYKILKKLETGGLVASHRGVYGGYSLARELSDITLYDIFVAVEEEINLNECMRDGYSCPNNHGDKKCHVHGVLRQVQSDLVDMLRAYRMDEVLAGKALAAVQV